MKNKYINELAVASLVACAGLLSTSCNDFLEEENPNETLVENYWKNLSDTKSGLYATYAALRDDYVLSIREEAWRSDCTWPGFGRPVPSSNASGWNWYNQVYNASTSAIDSKWKALYRGVWRANQVIEALNNLKEQGIITSNNEAEWRHQMGQARFMRGLFYFYLHSSFNNGSVVLRKNTQDDYYLPLSSSDEVLAFYREDLDSAYVMLPKTDAEGGANYHGLPLQGAAATIQGLSYLYNKNAEGKYDYAKAEAKFADVINNAPYKLEQDWEKMFTTAGELNSESILEIQYSLDYRTDITTWDPNCMYNRLATISCTNGGFYPAAWLVYEYNQDQPDPKDERNAGRNVSLRASSMVALINDFVTPYYVTGNAYENCQIGTGSWGFGKFKKYTNHDIVTAETPSMSGKNVTINRLSDVYLLYAECLLMHDYPDVEGALKYINEVRARWGVVLLGKTGKYEGQRTYNGITYTKQSLMEHLMYVERPLELCCEGHQIRWQDLLRWGLLEDDSNNIFKYRHHEAADYFEDACTTTYTLDGEAGKARYRCMVTKEPTEYSLDYEFQYAAQNYKKSNNAYFPIPQSETKVNPNIK